MIEATIAIKGPEWLRDLSDKSSARFRVLDSVPLGGGGVRDLMEIKAPEDKLHEAMEEIKIHPKLHDVDITPTDKDRALGTISTTHCPVCSTLAASDCFLVGADLKGEKIIWTLLTGGRNSLKNLIDKMKKNNFEIEIIKISDIKSKKALTSRQEEIIRIALDKGYFEYPKRISIRELASIFGVSISTLSEILRTGQKKILRTYFHEKKGI